MKAKTIIFLLNALAVGFPLSASANNQPNYYCKINRVVMPASNSEDVLRYAEKTYVGEIFSVERETGLMTGIVKNSYVTKPVVIDMGSTENSYKVISTLRPDEGLGPGSNIYALTINEYEAMQDKSFVFLSNDSVYLGTCKHTF